MRNIFVTSDVSRNRNDYNRLGLRALTKTGLAKGALSLAIFVLVLAATPLTAQKIAITTQKYDNLRTGWNNQEKVLTPANVGSSSFGILASVPLDAQVNAQPLIVPNQTINAHNKSSV